MPSSDTMIGRLIGIARRTAPRARMESVDSGEIVSGAGLVGDHKGGKFPGRGITVLVAEDWAAALADLAASADPRLVNLDSPDLFPDSLVPLKWTMRRANLLVEHLRLPRVSGVVLRIGAVRLEVTTQTYPCRRMTDVHPGLMKTLAKHWRGGVSCRVITGGTVRIGDTAAVESSPGERTLRLPG